MPKNLGLEYEAQVPAFLQRLKAGEAERDGRHNVAIPRARGMGRNSRLDMKGEDGEDEPLVLDEHGNEITKEEMKEMEKAKDEIEPEADQYEAELEKRAEDRVSSGFGKKRKAIKVVGDEVVEKDAGVEPGKSLEKSTKDLESVVAEGKVKAKKDTAAKKRKKVKLSFDDPD